MITPLNIILICLIIAAIAYLTYNIYKKNNPKYEHFTEDDTTPVTEESDEYASRLNVMKVFDAVLNRKPTVDEIKQYEITNNEQDLVSQVYENYQNEIKEKLTAPPSASATTNAALEEKPTVAAAAEKAALQKDVIGSNIAEVVKDIRPPAVTSSALEEKVQKIIMESTELTIYTQNLVDLSDKMLKGQKNLGKLANDLIRDMNKYSSDIGSSETK
jgi:uncharacterized membrane protein YebE (DUF533 family)